MGNVLIIGGGWAGCAAAVSAAKQGVDVTLAEKTDLLLGAGNVGGIMRNNGRWTAAEEQIVLGAGELFEVTDRYAVHKNVDFPGHRHASFYDAKRVEPAVRRLLQDFGVKLQFCTRAVDVKKEGNRITGVELLRQGGDSVWVDTETCVESTGSSGPMGNCMRQGNGCAMCIQRCPTFGPRVSLTERAGGRDLAAQRDGGRLGALSGSCKLEKKSLSPVLQQVLSDQGFVVIPLPKELICKGKLAEKVCQQYALDAFSENLILIDAGEAKLMTPYMPLEELRTIPGLEQARFLDPYGGGRGNSVRYMSVGQCSADMRADGLENLFLGGEKAGFYIGHTEAIVTGTLAGYNAARACLKLPLLTLPRTLASGELIGYGRDALKQHDGLRRRFTFAGGEFLEHMKDSGLYRESRQEIASVVEAEGLAQIYCGGTHRHGLAKGTVSVIK